MGIDIILVLIILVGALVLFALEIFSVDFVALGVMAALMGLSLVTPEQGISGFANTATITVMAMFILSAGLYRTGAIDLLTEKLLKYSGNSEVSQLLLVMVVVGPISAFLNNTAAVAILIPFAVKLAREHKRSPSRFLMPLSFTSQLAGVVTLLGTSTNILASSLSENLGVGAFNVFEFSHLGLIVMVVGLIYLLTIGRWLLPKREVEEEITERFHLKEYLSEVVITENSSYIDQTVVDLDLAKKFNIEVLDIIRNGHRLPLPLADHKMMAGDRLLIRTNTEKLLESDHQNDFDLQTASGLNATDVKGEDMELAELLIAPGSSLLGATLREINFRNRYGASVLAMSHHGENLGNRLPSTPLEVGDSLLIKAPLRVLQSLSGDPDFVMTNQMRQPPRRDKIPIALGIIVGVVLLAALGIQPILVTAIEGSVLMVLTGCLRIRELHQAIRWDVIFLLAGIIPLGIAMQNTGADVMVADFVSGLGAFLPPIILLALFYLTTTILTELISNNATVILLVPIATATAMSLGLDPKAFILAIMFSASTSFMTPVGYQTNTMVFAPGGYKFLDFTRVGAPLNFILWIVSTLVIAWLWGI